jgi:feruloyl esterase
MAFSGLNYFSQMVHEKPDWDYRTFEFDAELAAAVAKTAQALDATDPNLAAFSKRGGKLVMYHGWQDPAIPALSTVQYYDEVVRTMGSDATHAFARLCMAPGVQHCSGGPGPDAFGGSGDWSSADPARNLRAALVEWVENGTAPGPVIATKYDGPEPNRRALVTRPVCAHPQQAKYRGTGDPSSAATFTCQ